MKRTLSFVILATAIFFSIATVAYAQIYGPAFRIEYSTDRAGSDITGLPVGDIGQCMDECAAMGSCRSFTFVDRNQQPPNYDNSRPLCWIKNGVPGRRRNSGMISGVKQ